MVRQIINKFHRRVFHCRRPPEVTVQMKLLTLAFVLVGLHCVQATDDFRPTVCEGTYPQHLQGICTDGKERIYWCWTDKLVKTDCDGRVLKEVTVASHHGDLCYREGRVYVAVNLGKFNRPAGEADSWVYVYDGDTLTELAKHPVPEVVHARGGHGVLQGEVPHRRRIAHRRG